MRLIDLERRLAALEASRGATATTRILADRPISDLEAADALANWRAWVAQGRASLHSGVLCIERPEMTVDQWADAHVTAQ